MNKFVIENVEWAQDLERGLEEYLDSLFESMDSDDPIDTLSGTPFCGCTTCLIREMLCYSSPIIMNGQNNGDIELAE